MKPLGITFLSKPKKEKTTKKKKIGGSVYLLEQCKFQTFVPTLQTLCSYCKPFFLNLKTWKSVGVIIIQKIGTGVKQSQR